jgi:microcystin-dependent protein
VAATLGTETGSILLSKLVNGILSADVTGRSKMADGFVTTAQLATGSVTAAKLGATYYTMPTGSISLFAGEICPSGWLECNGAEYLIATYQNLYWVCRDVWGVPSLGTKFKVPDLRGWFGRGWDHGAGADPNAATRVKPTGAQGNNVGTWQGDDLKAHTHTLRSVLQSLNTGVGTALFWKNNSGNPGPSLYATTANTGLESMPKNKSLMVIVKT